MQFSFSNCGVSGNIGPTQDVATSCYKDTLTNVQIVDKGIQKWTVPSSGTYIIEAAGAAGGLSCTRYSNGKGAVYRSKFNLNKNDILYILVGQQGTFPNNNDWGGPGGGATFIAKKVRESDYLLTVDESYAIPLLIAAGGSGTGDCNSNGSPKDGGDGLCEQAESAAGKDSQGKAGAGFSVNNADGSIKSFLNGGTSSCSKGNGGLGCGGFGCGGSPFDAAGGGGGYKGGDSNTFGLSGTGGFSFNSGTRISCVSGKNNGHGYARIDFFRSLNDNGCTCRKSLNSVFVLSFIIMFVIS